MLTLEQNPSAGQRLVRYCGDVLRIELRVTGDPVDDGEAFVRTNLQNAAVSRKAMIDEVEHGVSGGESGAHEETGVGRRRRGRGAAHKIG